MAATQRQLRDTVQEMAINSEERFEGYRGHLAATTLDIIAAERGHAVVRMNIVQKVTDLCERLGDMLERQVEGDSVK